MKQHYYICAVVELDPEEEGWDASCDRTFGLSRFIKKPAVMCDYYDIKEKQFKVLKNAIFDEGDDI